MKVADFAGFLSGLSKAGSAKLALVFGPDAGIVHERATGIAAAILGAEADPFRLVHLEGDDLFADPGRLLDEASTISLFGGLRLIWVRVGAKPLQAIVAPLLATPSQDAFIIVEAGDLKTTNPLRVSVEQSTQAAIICYGDESRSLETLIAEILRSRALTIDGPARERLVQGLGADRAASRQEIEKLALYCHDCGSVGLADVEAVLCDVGVIEDYLLIDAAFLGKVDDIDREGIRLFQEGLDPGVLLGGVLRHAIALRSLLQTGGGFSDQAAKRLGVFYKRNGAVERQLRLWRLDRVDRVIAQVGEATLLIRRMSALAQPIALRLLWSVAFSARRLPQ